MNHARRRGQTRRRPRQTRNHSPPGHNSNSRLFHNCLVRDFLSVFFRSVLASKLQRIQYPLRRRPRMGRRINRDADDQPIRARIQGFLGSERPFLRSSAFSAPVRIPGVTNWISLGRDWRNARSSSGEQTNPLSPARTASAANRSTCAPTGSRQPTSRSIEPFMLVSTVTPSNQRRRPAGFQRRLPRRSLRRPHHLQTPAGVNGQHLHTQPCRRRHGLRHGVWDVVKLQIQKHGRPSAADPAHDLRPGAHKQFTPDLQGAHHRANLLRQGQRRVGCQHVQSHDNRILHAPDSNQTPSRSQARIGRLLPNLGPRQFDAPTRRAGQNQRPSAESRPSIQFELFNGWIVWFLGCMIAGIRQWNSSCASRCLPSIPLKIPRLQAFASATPAPLSVGREPSFVTGLWQRQTSPL